MNRAEVKSIVRSGTDSTEGLMSQRFALIVSKKLGKVNSLGNDALSDESPDGDDTPEQSEE